MNTPNNNTTATTATTITVNGWMPHDPKQYTTEAPPIRLMVEDFNAETIEEAAAKAREQILRNDPWLGEESMAFAFDKPDADIDDPNPWLWIVIEGVAPESC